MNSRFGRFGYKKHKTQEFYIVLLVSVVLVALAESQCYNHSDMYLLSSIS